LRGQQEKALCAANSLFMDGYLTTPGEGARKVRDWIESAGYEMEKIPPTVDAARPTS
jgi:biotin synthase-like enzyme